MKIMVNIVYHFDIYLIYSRKSHFLPYYENIIYYPGVQCSLRFALYLISFITQCPNSCLPTYPSPNLNQARCNVLMHTVIYFTSAVLT